MDSGETFSYMIGFMDCYELFGASKKDQTIGIKKAFILEQMFQAYYKDWSSDELNQKYDELQQVKIPDKIAEFMQKKVDHVDMVDSLKLAQIDWKFYLK